MINRNMNYVWRLMEMNLIDYNELTKKLIIRAFNNPSILEPIEEMEYRVLLVPQTKLSGQIKRALQGKVVLEPLVQTFV